MAKEKTILVNDPILGSGKKQFRCTLSGSYKEEAFVVYKHDKAFVNVLAALYYYIAKFTIQDEKERKIAQDKAAKAAKAPAKKEVKRKTTTKVVEPKKQPMVRALETVTEGLSQTDTTLIDRIAAEFFSSRDASTIDWSFDPCITLYPELNDTINEYEQNSKELAAQKESEAKEAKTKPHSWVYHFSISTEDEINKFTVAKRPQYVPESIPLDSTYVGEITVEHNKKEVKVSVFCDENEGDAEGIAPLFIEYFKDCDEYEELQNYMNGDVYIWSEYQLKQIPDDTVQWRRRKEEQEARLALESAKKRLEDARQNNGKKRKAQSNAIKSPKKQNTTA